MLNFIKTSNPGLGEIDLTKEINSLINQGKKVLWIISGGSNLQIETTIMRNLDQAHCSNLKILLGDERYGKKGHKDSNEQQLMDAGFDSGTATFNGILAEKSIIETNSDFSRKFDELLDWADISIGQFGIGLDGHTVGVLPQSIGTVNDDNAVSYHGPDFTRITLTLNAISKLNIAYIFSFGIDKQLPLVDLMENTKSVNNAPCLIFHKIHNVNVYNDFIGDKR